MLTVVSSVLCVTVVQGQNDWGVTYTSTHICALKGSTVQIRCSYRYPATVGGQATEVRERFWFIKWIEKAAKRVQYNCENNTCSLTITDLRHDDSALYKFRFKPTNQPGGMFYGAPGVTLSVTGTVFTQL